jgi:hypothetical protein
VACLRLMLRCLLVVTVALGVASAPLYAMGQVAEFTIGAEAHHVGPDVMVPWMPDHDHASPAKHHAMGQTCCHPGCIMAVVPGVVSLTTALMPWVAVPIPRDPRAPPAAPSGIDRPPKHA